MVIKARDGSPERSTGRWKRWSGRSVGRYGGTKRTQNHIVSGPFDRPGGENQRDIHS